MYTKILCPVDGSETSRRGAVEAIRLAKDQSAGLCFLHVVDNGAQLMYMPLSEEAFDVLRRSGQTILAEAIATARAQGVNAESRMPEIMTGRVGTAIVDAVVAFAPDLIVMGTHGRRGVSRLLLGSDAAIVVAETAVPVLLVK